LTVVVVDALPVLVGVLFFPRLRVVVVGAG
jgi:hypothetical protein